MDDGSTDSTPEIVRKFQPHVRLIQKTNGGQASAFNTGIPEAQGKIVAFLDGDDWWAKEKLRAVMDYLAARPQPVLRQFRSSRGSPHLLATPAGGRDVEENLITLCADCHGSIHRKCLKPR